MRPLVVSAGEVATRDMGRNQANVETLLCVSATTSDQHAEEPCLRRGTGQGTCGGGCVGRARPIQRGSRCYGAAEEGRTPDDSGNFDAAT